MERNWKAELVAREPKDVAIPDDFGDPAAAQRVILAVRAQMAEARAVKWCEIAGEEHARANRLQSRLAWTFGLAVVLCGVVALLLRRI